MPEPPLDDHELRVIRGMIDEYETKRARAAIVGDFLADGKNFAVALAATIVVAVNVATFIVLLQSIK